jgi:hypothetical protein
MKDWEFYNLGKYKGYRATPGHNIVQVDQPSISPSASDKITREMNTLHEFIVGPEIAVPNYTLKERAQAVVANEAANAIPLIGLGIYSVGQFPAISMGTALGAASIIGGRQQRSDVQKQNEALNTLLQSMIQAQNPPASTPPSQPASSKSPATTGITPDQNAANRLAFERSQAAQAEQIKALEAQVLAAEKATVEASTQAKEAMEKANTNMSWLENVSSGVSRGILTGVGIGSAAALADDILKATGIVPNEQTVKLTGGSGGGGGLLLQPFFMDERKKKKKKK